MNAESNQLHFLSLQLIPVMLEHRLCPPPEESYSLHRKMSGCFLLCAKLGSRVTCGPIFEDIYRSFQREKAERLASQSAAT